MARRDVMQQRVTLSVEEGASMLCACAQPHRHEEICACYAEAGEVLWHFADRKFTISTGYLAVFWAGFPHQAIRGSEVTRSFWLTVPLELFLEWHLPDAFKRSVMSGHVFVEDGRPRSELDRRLFQTWRADLEGSAASHRRWALFEIEARLGRMADAVPNENGDSPTVVGLPKPGQVSSAARIARFLSEHYTEPVYCEEAAQAAGLSSTAARKCFAHYYGMSLYQYLLTLRVTRAKELLASENAKVIDVAMEAGFPTLSNFYRSFEAIVGQTPSAYRRNCGAGQEPEVSFAKEKVTGIADRPAGRNRKSGR
jgi:AraC family transcriptional regulator, melibiose operon regulatory protein